MTYTAWTDHDPVCEVLTVVEGTACPEEGQHLLHTIEAPDWNAAMAQYHEFMGWEPYKPIV